MLHCNVFSPFSEVCENPTRGRSWFFTSVGLEVFHVKILCPLFLFLSAEFSLLDVSRTACQNLRPYLHIVRHTQAIWNLKLLSSCVRNLGNFPLWKFCFIFWSSGWISKFTWICSTIDVTPVKYMLHCS